VSGESNAVRGADAVVAAEGNRGGSVSARIRTTLRRVGPWHVHTLHDLAIVERLANSDPSNAGWQRDLSVSYQKVGEVEVEQGQYAQALDSYQHDLAIARRLAESDPSNGLWQRDLSQSYAKLGAAYGAQKGSSWNLPERAR
jgi:hypothetical protein